MLACGNIGFLSSIALLILPPSWQSILIVAAAIIGGYAGLFVLYKIKSAFSSAPVEEEAPVVAAAPVATGDIPDIDSDEFGAFLESEENVAKLIESFEK